MTKLFEPGKIGSLQLPNRLIRSATAERLASEEGSVTPKLVALYQELALGGVGLIISGHLYIHPQGKCHTEMTAIYEDRFIPGLQALTDAVHTAGGKVAAQINYGGLGCSTETVETALSASDVFSKHFNRPAHAMVEEEVLDVIQAYGKAARRAKKAGFDAVQIHGAHGYLISQFLSPLINRRTDRWGGSPEKRMQFLRDVAQCVRENVGPDYPVLIKLGLMDGIEGGLSLAEGLDVLAALPEMGIDAVEISGGFSGEKFINSAKGIKPGQNEAYFHYWAEQARPRVNIPILLVGGFRSKNVMEETLAGGSVDFISLCRPLISEPDLPNRLKQGLQDHSICISGSLCYPVATGQGIACRCKVERAPREISINGPAH